MSRLVMLFGAGASIPYFSPRLDTNALTDAVQNEDRWTSLISNYKSIKDDGVAEVDWSPIQCRIAQALSLQPCLNFEELIELIDKYCSYAIEGGHDSVTRPKRLHNLLRYFEIEKPLQFSATSWVRVPLLFRQVISEAIDEWNTYCRAPDYLRLLERQSDFLSAQEPQGDLSLYTSTMMTYCLKAYLKETYNWKQASLEVAFLVGCSSGPHRYSRSHMVVLDGFKTTMHQGILINRRCQLLAAQPPEQCRQ